MSENNTPKKSNTSNPNKAPNPFLAKVKEILVKNWPNTLRPITVLCAICLVTSLLLGLTNQITAPIITENNIKAADETRRLLLPAADSFEEISITFDGVVSMFKAKNDTGYIITAEAKGYGGMVPVMVAFNPEHQVSAVKFLDNAETPGLGKKVNTPKFENQFAGKESEELALSDIEAIASATISSSAAVNGINSAINAYNEKVKGETAVELTPEELRASLIPDAGALTKMDYTADGIIEVYKGEKYGFVIYAEGQGFYKTAIITAVGFDNDGVITGVWIDGSNETKGVGSQISKPKYAKSFLGKTDIADVEAVAGATVSSDGAKAAIQKCIDAFKVVKGA